jgi:cytochrome P450
LARGTIFLDLFPRRSTAVEVLAGFSIPAGTFMYGSFYMHHMNKEVFGDNPEKFIPARFKDKVHLF